MPARSYEPGSVAWGRGTCWPLGPTTGPPTRVQKRPIESMASPLSSRNASGNGSPPARDRRASGLGQHPLRRWDSWHRSAQPRHGSPRLPHHPRSHHPRHRRPHPRVHPHHPRRGPPTPPRPLEPPTNTTTQYHPGLVKPATTTPIPSPPSRLQQRGDPPTNQTYGYSACPASASGGLESTLDQLRSSREWPGR